MDWIKKNYDRFILALFAIALIAVSAMLFLSAQGFGEKFSDVMSASSHSNKIPEVDTVKIAAAKSSLDKPVTWSTNPKIHGGRLFTSELYYVKDGKLEKPGGPGSLYNHSRTGDPIPNVFFMEYSLPLLDPTVPFGDPDGDGFNNEDEWLNGGKGVVKEGVQSESTDPTSKDSHPAYISLLTYSQYIPVQFRLRFNSWDGDPKNPDAMTFQINTLDLRQPTEFLKIGEGVKGTTFKLKKFEFKETENKSTGVTEDVSELTIVNTETEEEVVLVLRRIVDSPNRRGSFSYRWNKKKGEPDQVIPVQKLREFVLLPQTDKRYKLLDVNQENAVIQTPDGQKITIPLLKK